MEGSNQSLILTFMPPTLFKAHARNWLTSTLFNFSSFLDFLNYPVTLSRFSPVEIGHIAIALTRECGPLVPMIQLRLQPGHNGTYRLP